MHFHLPAWFGKEFILKTFSLRLTEWREKYGCKIELTGTLLHKYYKGDEPLLAVLQGTFPPNLFQCQEDMEDALFQAVDAKLRGCLLVDLVVLNKHRPIQDGIVQSRNPHCKQPQQQHNGDHDMMYHMTTLQAGRESNPEQKVIGFHQAKEWWNKTLLSKYPKCQMELVELCPSPHNRVHPHILLWSQDYNDVYKCRQDFKTLLQREKKARHRAAAPSSCSYKQRR
jgi:hypothetical protein